MSRLRRTDWRLFFSAPSSDLNPRRPDVDAGSIASNDLLEVEQAPGPSGEQCDLFSPELSAGVSTST